MNEFEKLLQENLVSLRRYVNFKVDDSHDAEDIFQEVCLTAAQKFETLKDRSAFKAWLIGIAGHKCKDYYRKKARRSDISLDSLPEIALCTGKFNVSVRDVVQEVLETLGEKEKQILSLYFFQNLSQATIAKRLSLPLGTVKSRLHYAKERFKQHYPYKIPAKGEMNMKKIPEYLPKYTIRPSAQAPFSVKWEELQGWLLIPRLGEELTWGLYDGASGKRTEFAELKTLRKAMVHGIEGVEFSVVQNNTEDYYRTGSEDKMERTFVAQLTDTHCRLLAENHIEDGVHKLYTFLDGEVFLNNWGFGEDNCGNAVALSPKNLLLRDGNNVTGHTPKEVVDIVGRYQVTLCDKTYDTICVMDLQCYNDAVASEQYLDANGRTVLWRRFNKNDWAYHRYGKLWTELLPENERLIINGETYVHWYDCATEYIF